MCLKARWLASFCLLAIGVAARGQVVTGFGKWFQDQVASRVTVTGYRQLSYHIRSVTGDLESYDNTEYGGQGLSKYTDFGQVQVSGNNVMGVLNFDVNIQDSRFQDPQANRVSLNYQKGLWGVDLGDIHGSLSTNNRFARFDKSLTGSQVAYKTKHLEARAIYSEVRGQARTVSLQGNNTSGPYYLQSSQIVRGSEQILVDGVLQKFGDDYTMDYDIGSVSFVNHLTFEGKIIPPTSTIVATYEVFGFNGTSGRLEAASVSYDMGKAGKIGLTEMRQIQGTDARGSTYQQQFLGPIAAGTSLILKYEPLDLTLVKVYIGSQLQTYHVDYEFNAENSSVMILLRPVPPDTILTIVYVPKPVSTVDGDRDVLGLDYRLPLGRNGTVTYSQAFGRLSNTLTPKSGTARGVDLRYAYKNAQLSASVRDIPDDFVSIETAGFERNERAQEYVITFNPEKHFEYGFSHRNLDVSTLDANNQSSSTRFTTFGAYAQLRPRSGGSPWQLSQDRTETDSVSGHSRTDTTTFGSSGKFGRAQWKLDLSNEYAVGPTTINGTTAERKINLETLGYRITYGASDAWQMNMNTSLSRIVTGGDSSIGRDLSFGIQYRPSDKFETRLDMADSDAGRLATLGFLGGYGSGYNGNGFSSGADESVFTGATDARTVALSSSFTPREGLSFTGNTNYYKSSGGVSTNTETVGYGLGVNWDISKYVNLYSTYDTSTTTFLDSTLRSSATNVSFYLDGRPKGPWRFNGGLSFLISGGNSQYNQNMTRYEASLTYKLAQRHSLIFSMDNGRLSGYLPQETRNTSLTYQYQIWRSLALNIGYRTIDVVNRDPSLTSGQYSSRGLDIELQFNFGR